MERAPVPWPGQRWGPGRPPASLQGSTSFPKTDYEFGASRLERSVRETVSLAGPLRGRGRMLVKIATILNRFCRYYRRNCSRGLLLYQIDHVKPAQQTFNIGSHLHKRLPGLEKLAFNCGQPSQRRVVQLRASGDNRLQEEGWFGPGCAKVVASSHWGQDVDIYRAFA